MWGLLSGYKSYLAFGGLVIDAVGGLMGWWEPDPQRWLIEGGIGGAALRHALSKMDKKG